MTQERKEQIKREWEAFKAWCLKKGYRPENGKAVLEYVKEKE